MVPTVILTINPQWYKNTNLYLVNKLRFRSMANLLTKKYNKNQNQIKFLTWHNRTTTYSINKLNKLKNNYHRHKRLLMIKMIKKIKRPKKEKRKWVIKSILRISKV